MADLKFDINNLSALRIEFKDAEGAVDKALRGAIKATSAKAATAISRDIRGIYDIKASDIKQRLSIRRYKRDASSALVYTGKRIPLADFKPKQKTVRTTATSKKGKRFKTKRRGVTVRTRKDIGRKLVYGWYAKDHVMRRRWSSENDSDPIIRYGPSIPGMVAYPDTIERAQEVVRRELPKEFSGRLDYFLNKK